MLADRSRGESLAKSLIFMPMAISFVGASVIWRFVYAFTPAGEDQIGVLNAAWVGLGDDPKAWLQQPPWNTLFLIAIMIWIQTGFAMVRAVVGHQGGADRAARGGARRRGQRGPGVLAGDRAPDPHDDRRRGDDARHHVLKIYDIVKVMTNGEFSTSVIANEMFDQAFINRDYGVGSALAVLLLIAVLPLMVVNVRRNRQGARA